MSCFSLSFEWIKVNIGEVLSDCDQINRVYFWKYLISVADVSSGNWNILFFDTAWYVRVF